jgi:peptidoglycan hydrolase-like protein with peptidoglycan-binding domain
MTPRQARVALGAFVLLAGGVTGNALYLQGDVDRAAGRPPAPLPRVEPQKPSTPPAEPRPKSARTSQHAAAAPSPDPAKAAPPPALITEPPPADRAPPQPPAETQSGAKGQSQSAQVKVRVVRVATIGDAPPEDTDPETVRAVQGELNRLGYGPVAADGAIRPELRAAIIAFEHEHRLPLTGEATQALLKQLLFGAPAAPTTSGPPEAPSPHAQAMIRQVQQMLADRGYRPGAVDGRLSPETVAAIRTFEVDQGLVPKGRISVALLERLESGMGGGGRHKAP